MLTASIEEAAGTLLGILVLLDIFLIVLYARPHTGLISRVESRVIWRGMVRVSGLFGRHKEGFLTLTGPVILISVLLSWALLLSLAAALIIHPNLGTGVRASNGDTPHDFITALYVGGSSLAFMGASDFTPQNSAFRLFYLLTSVTGVSIVSLTITYLMQLFNDLKERNAQGLKVHMISAETGDAAEAIARLGPQGDFESGYQVLADWAAKTAEIRESHAFYDMLFYFRFHEPYYSVSRTALTSLDTVALIKSALDDKEYGWLKESSGIESLGRSSLLELKSLATLSPIDTDFEAPPDEATRERWRRRYEAGVKRIRKAGIKTKNEGVEQYIALRSQWDRYISEMAPAYAYEMDEIDPALAKIK
jgi:hypothetical protein